MIFLLFFAAFVVAMIWAIIRSLFGKLFGLDDNGEEKAYREKHHIPEKKVWGSYDQYLRSYTWKKKRRAVMDRADGICEVEGCDRKAAEVHHKKYPSEYGREPLDWLQAVCRPCHDEKHPDKPDRGTDPDEARKVLKEAGIDIEKKSDEPSDEPPSSDASD